MYIILICDRAGKVLKLRFGMGSLEFSIGVGTIYLGISILDAPAQSLNNFWGMVLRSRTLRLSTA